MRWLFSEEIFFAIATWQWFLGLGLALALAVLIKKFEAVKPASRYGVWATAFFTVAILPWIALWPGKTEVGSEPLIPTSKLAQKTLPATQLMEPMTRVVHSVEPMDLPATSQAPLALETLRDQATQETSNQTTDLSGSQGSAPFTIIPVEQRSTPGLAFTKKNGMTLLWTLWAVMASIFGLKLIHGIRRLSQLKREANPLEGPLQHWYQETLQQLQIRRQPKLFVHQAIGSPLVAGLFKPAILVPEPLLHQLSGEELQQILLHELAHIRRFDDWVHLFQKAILALLWFHPAMHWLSKQMAWDRESACDDWAISLTGKSKQYAKSLLRVSESMLQPHAGLLTVGAVRGQKQLSHRIESLLKSKGNTDKFNNYTKILLFLLFFSCIASMAIAGPKLVWFQDKQPTEKTPHEVQSSPALPPEPSSSSPTLPPEPATAISPTPPQAHAIGIARIPVQGDETSEEATRQLRHELEKLREERAQLRRELRQLEHQRREQRQPASRKVLVEKQKQIVAQIAAEQERLIQELKDVSHSGEVDQKRVSEIEKKHLELQRELRALEQKAHTSMQRAASDLEKAEQNAWHEQQRLEDANRSLEQQQEAYQEQINQLQHQLDAQLEERREARDLEHSARKLEQSARRIAQSQAAMEREFHRSSEAFSHGPDVEVTDRGIAYGSASGKSRTTYKNDDFKMEIRGRVFFSEDETDLTYLTKKSYFKLTDNRARGTKHQLTVTPGKDGEPIYDYKRNRAKKPFDDQAKAWLRETLPGVLMSLGIGADLRIEKALQSKSNHEIIDMVAGIDSDFSQERHFLALMKLADLNSNELNSLGHQITKMNSDFHQARLLSQMAQHYQNVQGVTGIIAQGVKEIQSDFEKRRVLSQMLPLAEDQATLQSIFDMTASMGSDFEKRQILTQASELFSSADLADSGYLGVLEHIQSDFEFSQGILGLSTKGELSPEQTLQLLQLSSNHLSSDFELARVFNHLADSVRVNAPFKQAFKQVGSEHSKSQILQTYIQRGDLDQAEQSVLLQCAQTIGSEHQRAKILKSFRNHYSLEGELAREFQAAVSSIRSEHLRKQLTDY